MGVFGHFSASRTFVIEDPIPTKGLGPSDVNTLSDRVRSVMLSYYGTKT